MMAEGEDTNPTIVSRRAIVLNALRQLLEHGLVVPLQRFHAQIKRNEQERRIARATVEPCLTPTADCIAAVVEAECPTSCPTLKGLIQEDVAASTEELK
jgi:hypothetical protein